MRVNPLTTPNPLRIMRNPAEEGLGRNTFQNRSGPGGDVNPGNNGKFNDAQTEDRLRIHAISIATGSPTIPQMVTYYKERYGIDIALQTEKTWRASNRERIDRKKMELIESGEIKVPVVSEEVLSDSMLELTIQTSRLSQGIRKRAQQSLLKINLEGSDTEEAREKNLEILAVFKTLSSSLALTNKAIKDQLDSLFGFSSKIKIKDKEVQKLVDKHFDSKMKTANEAEEADEDEPTEITDEMRNQLLGD
jgi:hypothetical protein